MKKNLTQLGFVLVLTLSGTMADAQTFTMGGKCRDMLTTANEALHNKAFDQAIQIFTDFSGSCKTKDAKILGAVGQAEAYNGLGEYEKAIEMCDDALDRSKGKNLIAHFQKAIALENMNNPEGARDELNAVIELTENNQNTRERASNYALMAALYDRQLGDRDSALYFLDTAIALDGENTDFLIQKGDMYVISNEYDKAFEAYDAAVAKGRSDMDMYIIRSNGRLKMLEHKYGTSEARQLREKMTDEDKKLVCDDLRKALDLGWKDMNKDMFAALVCK